MRDVNSCPACQNTILEKKYLCEDHTVSHETFQILQCSRCTLAVTSPRPEEDKIGRYYLSEKYISHTGTSEGIIDKIYLAVRKYTLRKKLQLINRLTNAPGKILDYGCGTGEFLLTCQRDGWEVHGVEPSEKARSKAEKMLTSAIDAGLQDNVIRYDVITLWHVLEHVTDFNLTIQTLANKLKDDGTIVVAVPNYKSFDGQYYKEYWAGFDVPRHLWHFTMGSMQVILKKNSLRLVQVIPMMFDSFYVSMLSEEYKRKNQTLVGIIRAMFIGLLSNIKAKKGTNHSSLIYIIKK